MLHFVFDGPPGPEGPRFVECETPEGKSVNAGEWHQRADGLWELRVATTVPAEPTDAMANAGAHCNSEWLNDNAPIGERRYRDPAMAVWRTMLRVALGQDPNHGLKT